MGIQMRDCQRTSVLAQTGEKMGRELTREQKKRRVVLKRVESDGTQVQSGESLSTLLACMDRCPHNTNNVACVRKFPYNTANLCFHA